MVFLYNMILLSRIVCIMICAQIVGISAIDSQALLLMVATCASAYYYVGSHPYRYTYGSAYYGGYSPFLRKKRSAPEAPAAEDQQADSARFYSSYYGHPISAYSGYYPYSGVHYLKKREAPAEDQKAQDATIIYSGYNGYPYAHNGYPYSQPMYYFKK